MNRQTVSLGPGDNMRETAECRQLISPNAGGVILRSVAGLHPHPAYTELKLAVSSARLAVLKRAGWLAFKDPLLVTREGVIIDGYARKECADNLGISTLPCVEIDADTEEALHLILNRHRRSPGWNDYNRIRMVSSQLKDGFRELARFNQQAGGSLKGSSKLTEVSVRKRVAEAAGVSEGNVTKVDQLFNSDPQVLDALAKGEIRIHRAWLWRRLSAQKQREQLRLYRLKRGLTQPPKILAFKHRANNSSTLRRVSLSVANLDHLLEHLLSMQSSDCESSDSIAIGLIKFPCKAALLTTDLFEDLLARRSVNQHATFNDTETVS
jgi:ParB-like chromosome segregation protein Spo0J